MKMAFCVGGLYNLLVGKERRKSMQTAATAMTTDLETIKGAIAAKFDQATYTSWIAPLTFDIENNTLVLGAQNQFSANFINGVHFGTLSGVASSFGLALKIVVRNASVVAASVAFDSFVTCDENLFVVSACKKVATGSVPFSPLFIYGVAGCGKTLLTECIAGAATGRVVKMSGSQFVSEFTRSLKEHNVFAFKDFCRKCDTFILDDVQALSGKRASTDEFMQLIVDLRNAGKNVVLTANAAPNNLTGFDRHAQGLLASGLVADVVAPNAYVKSVMLRRAGVTSDVADALCSRIANDGHMISGVAKKIRAYVDLMGASVDMAIATRLLADTLQTVKTPVAMVRAMCEKLGVSYDAVCGTGRSRALVLARQTMMVVLKQATQLSLSEIGNFVGGRDHATVLYAIKQIEKQLASDLVLSAQIQQLVSECR